MASRYKFSEEEIKEIEQARKKNKDKRAETESIGTACKRSRCQWSIKSNRFSCQFSNPAGCEIQRSRPWSNIRQSLRWKPPQYEHSGGSSHSGAFSGTRWKRGNGWGQWDCKGISGSSRPSGQQRTNLLRSASAWMAEDNASEQTPQKASEEEIAASKKLTPQ